MIEISTILEQEINRLQNLTDTIQSDIDNFEKNYEAEMQNMLSNAENFDVDNVSVPDSQQFKDKQNMFMGTSQFLQGGTTDIGTYVGAFKAVSGSIGLIGKGLKKLFKSNPKIHISKIPSNKINNAYESHNLDKSQKPYLFVDNGDNGLNSVIYTRKGISVSNVNLNRNYFFDWSKIEKIELKQVENGVFIFFNQSDNINLKFFYDGSQSKLGLLFYIAQNIKNLNNKPEELKKTLPKIVSVKDNLISAKEKFTQNPNFSISQYTKEYEFDNLNSFIFYKMSDTDYANFVKINFLKFKELLNANESLEIDEIVDLLRYEFDADVFYQDVNKETKQKIENKLQAIGGELNKYNKQKEFIETLNDLNIADNNKVATILEEIKKEQFDKNLFRNTIQEIEQDREEYLEYKRKRDTKITVIVIVAVIVAIALFVVIMNLTQN